jgi:hypothetical protein
MAIFKRVVCIGITSSSTVHTSGDYKAGQSPGGAADETAQLAKGAV